MIYNSDDDFDEWVEDLERSARWGTRAIVAVAMLAGVAILWGVL